DHLAVIDLVDGVAEAPRRVPGEERGLGGWLGDAAHGGELRAREVEAKDVDLGTEAADVHHRSGTTGGLATAVRAGRQQERGHREALVHGRAIYPPSRRSGGKVAGWAAVAGRLLEGVGQGEQARLGPAS